MTSSPSFQPWCPQGGQWYACGNGTKFTGCCTSNPCNSNGCFAGNLRPASFRNLTAYGKFSDQVCSAGLWYTCTGTNPAFLGCCTSNPCAQNGCPTADLRAGYLSSNAAEANTFDPQPPLPSLSSTTSATASSTTSSNTATSTAVVTPITNSNSIPTAAIIGAAAGGGVFIILILLAAFFIFRHRKRAQQKRASANTHLLPGKDWPSPSTAETSPYLGDTRKLPMYSSYPNTPLLQPHSPPAQFGSPTYQSHHIHEAASTEVTAGPPKPHIYEAGSREVTYVAYSPHFSHSPQTSPTYPRNQTSASGGQSVSGRTSLGYGVEGVGANSTYARAQPR